jgi:5-methylcytosine-specific restriction endonuclease McrA
MKNRRANTTLTDEQLAANVDRVREWRERNPERRRLRARRNQLTRRARQHDAFIEDIDGIILYERDMGICGICKTVVNFTAFHIDHVVPLSKGGLHKYENVQIAHPLCNIKKGARIEHNG